MALVALTMAVLISLAALSIDVGTLYEAKAEAQRAADAAALTAARVISISGITTDPLNAANSWQAACGGATSTATQAAVSMAQQNFIGGVAVAPASVNVNYIAGNSGTANADCSKLGTPFGVNPVVTVSLQRTNLPVFFARIFSLFGSTFSGASVSATASAEAFNPSGSFVLGEVPVNPRCVKPWFVPNLDPRHTTGTGTFVSPTVGQIINPGTFSGNNGVVGETFNLVADCNPATAGSCVLNPGAPTDTPPSTLQYLPGAAPATSVAIAANGTINGCSQVQNATYWNAVAGCDQSTIYACGNSLANNVDLADNPGLPGNDSVNAAQCLINESASGVGSGQDYLAPGPSTGPYTYPFQILAGGNSALISAGVASGSQITSSPSIVSLPIYDSGAVTIFGAGASTPVTVIGFLQVFINNADNATGNINVTVMNVAGCGNSFGGTTVAFGTSPVPIRLITPP
ncbi:MAG: pilus assembly protein TadG-related protein [Candidatus Sulfotelmatobacter sp.]